MSVQWAVEDRCGACGGGAWILETAICSKRYGRCLGCGLVRLVDRLAEDQLSLIYANYYPQPAISSAALADQLRNPTFAFRRARLEGALDGRRRSVCEIGCGDGNFLAVLKAAGWSVRGTEHGATAERASRRHQIDVRPIDSMRDTAQGVSVVAAYHVLEHIYDPAAWLASLARVMAPAALLHIQVPNYASAVRHLMGEAWSSWRLPEHVNFYTPRTVRDALASAGFDVLDETTWDPWHGPGATTASFVNAVHMRRTGRSPWTADISTAWPGRNHDHPLGRRSVRRRVGRAGVTAAAHVFARIAARAGRGEVVDVIAVLR